MGGMGWVQIYHTEQDSSSSLLKARATSECSQERVRYQFPHFVERIGVRSCLRRLTRSSRAHVWNPLFILTPEYGATK